METLYSHVGVRRHPFRSGPGSGPEPGQSLGAGRQSHRHVVGGQRGHGHQYPVHTSKPHVSVDPFRRGQHSERLADRYRLQQRHGVQSLRKRQNGPSTFLFANADGTISGWNPRWTHSCHHRGDQRRRVYLGLAVATDVHGRRGCTRPIFNGKVDVYDQTSNWNKPARQIHGLQIAGQLPSVQHPGLNGKLYVEYAPADQVLAGKSGLGEGLSMSTTPTASCSRA